MTNEYGLGRLHNVDERDRQYPAKMLLADSLPDRKFRYWWDHGIWLDQGNTPQCTAYSALHFLEDGSVTQFPLKPGAPPISNPVHIYNEAQKRDGFPLPHDGSTIRAVMKVLTIKRLVTAYYWAWDLETLVDTVLHHSPVIVGTNWYRGMFYPDKDGIIKVAGANAGGHAYVINGVNVEKRLLRIKNSWGRDWGAKGRAWISFDDMARLIGENAEVAIATERQRPIDEPPS